MGSSGLPESPDIPYLRAMGRKLYEWRIFRIRSRAAFIGYAQAPDEVAAIKVAIKKYEIAPEYHDRLLALRQAELVDA